MPYTFFAPNTPLDNRRVAGGRRWPALPRLLQHSLQVRQQYPKSQGIDNTSVEQHSAAGISQVEDDQ
eukprot:CAMPEP_0204291614 /NCGR_PEP_ID=MMETSP0468-20130131/62824_1 /ASSEMBLY_ACC=CAM_ASM_000383 /TAXON_ID=2969 /ORGANISM="Oxyrrhis marina" /LENGTH=66 /DNA_ID=CAMNT_0051269915 /DNA_START=170 /DNA_END=370 /DNA_ORIENTATION=-